MRGRFFFCALALFALVGCRATAEVGIRLDESGRGLVSVQVELDEEAAARVGDLRGLLAVDDLERAGWEISSGAASVTATKSVRSESELDAALAEVGPPFTGLAFGRRESFARTDVEVSGSVDLSQGMASFGDEGLRRLTGSATGVDVPPESLGLSLEIDLPGQETSNAPGPGTRWALPIGAVTPVTAESTDLNTLGLFAVLLAVACAIGLLWALVGRLRGGAAGSPRSVTTAP